MGAKWENPQKLSDAVSKDLWNVFMANKEQNKIADEKLLPLVQALSDMFPMEEEYEAGTTKFPPFTTEAEVISRLNLFTKHYPMFRGVYKKYAAQVDKPVYCINCGTELVPSALFCPDCGTQVTSPEED